MLNTSSKYPFHPILNADDFIFKTYERTVHQVRCGAWLYRFLIFALILNTLLKNNPNVSLEDDDTVKLYGKSIPGSNTIDLVNAVIRHRKGSDPTGWQAFTEGLRDMHIPQDVIGNMERWDWMHRAPKTPETPETDYITPK